MVLHGEAQKHSFETKALKHIKDIKQIQKVQKQIAFIGAFKVPCTLP